MDGRQPEGERLGFLLALLDAAWQVAHRGRQHLLSDWPWS